MNFSIRNKSYSLGFILITALIFALCIASFTRTAFSEVTVVKSNHENKLYSQQIDQLHKGNKELKLHNKDLQHSIKKNQNLYKKQMANVKIAYLTFDDGPSDHTSDILTTLKKHNVKATFFINGHDSLRNKYKEISDGGHALANHTYSHDYKTIYSSADNFSRDTKKLDAYLTEVTGKAPNHILRYPGGSNNTVSHEYGGTAIMDTIIKKMNDDGYKYFDWNVDSTDASTYCQNKNKIVQEVLTQSTQVKHAIILMHDLGPKVTTVQALPEIIEGLKNQGYIFDVLSKDSYAPQFKVVS